MNNEYLNFLAIGLSIISSKMPRDWFEIVSGLSRERFGSLSQIYSLRIGLKMVREWFEIDSRFSREWLGEVGEIF